LGGGLGRVARSEVLIDGKGKIRFSVYPTRVFLTVLLGLRGDLLRFSMDCRAVCDGFAQFAGFGITSGYMTGLARFEGLPFLAVF
jgi:hypothetical protein